MYMKPVMLQIVLIMEEVKYAFVLKVLPDIVRPQILVATLQEINICICFTALCKNFFLNFVA